MLVLQSTVAPASSAWARSIASHEYLRFEFHYSLGLPRIGEKLLCVSESSDTGVIQAESASNEAETVQLSAPLPGSNDTSDISQGADSASEEAATVQ